jgi:NADH-quinone oxidoreductase subunit H
VFGAKVILFLFFYMWVRWTLPRFRFDQLMNLAWRSLIPLSLGTFLMAGIFVYLRQEGIIEHRGWLLLGNILLVLGALVVGRWLPNTTTNQRVPVPGSRYNKWPAINSTGSM